MRITERQLKRIIAEEIQKATQPKQKTIKVTASYLNNIIKEEYELFNKKKRLAESMRRRKRLAEARRRRLAEARRRRRDY